jgi:hypothetical protein
MNPVITIAAERERTRLLMTTPERDILKACLPSLSSAHPRAAATLLEALALWHRDQLSVVLVADELEGSFDEPDLVGILGIGQRSLHYSIAFATQAKRSKRRQRIPGICEFHDLQSKRLEVAW